MDNSGRAINPSTAGAQKSIDIDLMYVSSVGTGTGIAQFDAIELTENWDQSGAAPVVTGTAYTNLSDRASAVVLGTAVLAAYQAGLLVSETAMTALAVTDAANAVIPAAGVGIKRNVVYLRGGAKPVSYHLNGGAAAPTATDDVLQPGGYLILEGKQIENFRGRCLTPADTAALPQNDRFVLPNIVN